MIILITVSVVFVFGVIAHGLLDRGFVGGLLGVGVGGLGVHVLGVCVDVVVAGAHAAGGEVEVVHPVVALRFRFGLELNLRKEEGVNVVFSVSLH